MTSENGCMHNNGKGNKLYYKHGKGYLKNMTKYYWENPELKKRKMTNLKKTIIVIGDSMVKHVSIPNAIVRSFRGATTDHLIQEMNNEIKSTEESSSLFLHIGTNNLGNKQHPDDVMGSITEVIKQAKKQFPNCRLFINSIINRKDISSKVIKETNENIRWVCREQGAIFVDLGRHLDDSCLARDGLHLNRKGTNNLSRIICKVALLGYNIASGLPVKQVVKTPRNKNWGNNISVIESNMRTVIKEYRKDKSTAFAHCISADLNNDRQMSKGVAVVFREEFGKPSESDCLNPHLAYQKNTNEASVYSLITKQNFNDKPKSSDYNKSFCHLAEDFTKRGLKLLICSPMGCVRDQIHISQFISNLVRFQRITGAKVVVVVYKELSLKATKSRLPHQAFLRRIRELVYLETSLVRNQNQVKRDSRPANTKSDQQSTHTILTTLHLSAELNGQEQNARESDMDSFPPLPPVRYKTRTLEDAMVRPHQEVEDLSPSVTLTSELFSDKNSSEKCNVFSSLPLNLPRNFPQTPI